MADRRARHGGKVHQRELSKFFAFALPSSHPIPAHTAFHGMRYVSACYAVAPSLYAHAFAMMLAARVPAFAFAVKTMSSNVSPTADR